MTGTWSSYIHDIQTAYRFQFSNWEVWISTRPSQPWFIALVALWQLAGCFKQEKLFGDRCHGSGRLHEQRLYREQFKAVLVLGELEEDRHLCPLRLPFPGSWWWSLAWSVQCSACCAREGEKPRRCTGTLPALLAASTHREKLGDYFSLSLINLPRNWRR